MADWDALARSVIDRRVELGHHSREAFAKASRISVRTLGDVESARRPSYAPETLVRLERALDWPPGRVDEILAAPPPRTPDTYLINQATGERLLPSGRPIPEKARDVLWLLEDDSPLTDSQRRELGALVEAAGRFGLSMLPDKAPRVEEPEVRETVGRRR